MLTSLQSTKDELLSIIPTASSYKLDSSLHKDVFGVISGTGECVFMSLWLLLPPIPNDWLPALAKVMRSKEQMSSPILTRAGRSVVMVTGSVLFWNGVISFLQPPPTPPLPTSTLCVTPTPAALCSAPTPGTALVRRTVRRAALWIRYSSILNSSL